MRIADSFYISSGWRVTKIIPSLDPTLLLYRVQLLADDGTEKLKVLPRWVIRKLIRKYLGRYGTWQKLQS